MRKAATVAFAPAHITGFFEICDSPKGPLKKGSRGAGISLSKGVFTKVRLTPGGRDVSITINGKPSRAPVSRAVLRHFALKGFHRTGRLEIDHLVQVPTGSGFGTSGAGALSLALAMNSLLGGKLTKAEAAQIAHLAELECRTGLGTVSGEFVGGFEVRTKAGAPGVGKVVKLPMSRNLEVLCLRFGPVSKPTALSDPRFRRAVNKQGRWMVKALLKNPARFMELSRKFAESLPGLITPRMRGALNECDRAGIRCSVMMIGHALFAPARNKDEKRILLGIFRRNAGPKGKIVAAKTELKGARVLG